MLGTCITNVKFGLVYGLTKIPHEPNAKWYEQPITLAVLVAIILIILNIWLA